MEGVLILVIPFERLHDCAGILASRFTQLAVLGMTDEDSVKYRQIAVIGLRRDVRGAAVENNKRQLLSIGLYGSFLGLAELQPGACLPYSIPPSVEAELSYRGLPYDLLEDLLPQSGAWRQAAPLLMPHEDLATGRPITPPNGGHVGLLCTAGLLYGAFGHGEDRHIARWRSVKRNQRLQFHPHIHCVLAAGGIAPDHSSWISARRSYFLPIGVLCHVFRGKFVAGLRNAFHQGTLQFQGDLLPLAQPRAFAESLRVLFRHD
jgi:hypothetical protein